MKKTYLNHINGIKGLACIFIMICHYLDVQKKADAFPGTIRIVDVLDNSSLDIFVNEKIWLLLFLILSGYLCSKSIVRNTKELLCHSVKRLLRLGLPILASSVVIYVLYLLFDFSNGLIAIDIKNSWLSGFYAKDISIIDVILSPIHILILGESSVNAPLWVLRDMLCASIIIYILNLLSFLMAGHKRLYFCILILLTGISYIYSDNIFFCLMGAVVQFTEHEIIENVTLKKYIPSLILISLGLCVFSPKPMKLFVLFTALIECTPFTITINKILSMPATQFLGKISFGIYLFHWPVFCSIGSKLILIMGISAKSLIISSILCALITIIMSILFRETVEKQVDKVCCIFK